MNKNARPLVASTLRRIIITALLALVAMMGQDKTFNWKIEGSFLQR